jgi:exodeoxyribonuclease VII large subunit
MDAPSLYETDILEWSEQQAAVLRALNPAAALARGYTITMDENGQILRSAKDAMNSKELTTRFHDGEVKSQVRKT